MIGTPEVYWDDETSVFEDGQRAGTPIHITPIRIRRTGHLVAVLPMPPIGFVGVVMTSTEFEIVPLDKLRPGPSHD